MLTGFLGDLRFALRMMARHRIPTLVIVATLALAVGANTALFSVVHQVLLAPLPFPREEQLYFLWQGPGQGSVSPRNYQDWKDGSHFFELAAFDSFAVTLTGTSNPQRLNALQTSHDFLSVLGMPLQRGRFFSEAEDVPGGPPVAVISARLWRREFASDPQILTRQIVIDGVTRDVIGVLPDRFEFPGETRQDRYQVILPIGFTEHQMEESQRGAQWIGVVGRLQAGWTLHQAGQEFASIIQQLRAQTNRIPEDFEVTLVPVREQMVGDVKTTLWALFAALGVVLLLALFNVTGLMLARATARRGEFAVRSAVGASSGHLVRQNLIESLLVTFFAGGCGLLLALFLRSLLVALAPQDIPRLGNASLSFPVLLFSFLVTAGAGLLLGLTPVAAAWKLNLSDALADLQRSAQGSVLTRRLGTVLVGVEIALAVVVLSSAGLLARSLLNLEGVEPGFDPHNVLRFRLSLSESQYDTSRQVARFYQDLLQRLEHFPGVIRSGAIMHLPLGRDGNVVSTFSIENRPTQEGDERLASLRPVTPGYFASMGIPFLEGRDFRSGDDLEAPGVMIVNRAFADHFLAGERILGKRVRPHVGLAERGRWASIVGVVGDVHQQSLAQEPGPEMYIPHAQSPVSGMSLVVRTRTDARHLISPVTSIVRNLDPQLPLFDLATLGEIRDASLAPARFQAWLFGTFAAISLFLAVVGVFGLISYRISTQTAEIGVRRALGARDGQIFGLVVRQVLSLAGTGLLMGLLGALLAGRLLQSLLFRVAPSDPLTLIILTGVLMVAALLAGLHPTLRALRIAPLAALRGEERQ